MNFDTDETVRRTNVLELEINSRQYGSLILTDSVGWDDFPSYGREIARLIGAEVMAEHKTFDMRMFEVRVGSTRLIIIFEDFPVQVSLECSDPRGHHLLTSAREFLLEERAKRERDGSADS